MNRHEVKDLAGYDYQTYGEGLQAEGGYGYGVGQVFAGYGDAVAGAADAAYQTARHPLVAAQGVYTAFRHPFLTGQAIVDQYNDQSQSVRGQGQLVGDILTGVVTGGALKALKQTQVAQRVIEAGSAAARNAVDLAARVRVVVDPATLSSGGLGGVGIRLVPSRAGTRGRPDHIADVEGPGFDQARAQLRPGEIVLTEQPVQGYPGINRRPDNQIVGPDGRTRLVIESERRPTGSYHQRRVAELEAAGIEVQTRRLP